MIKVESPPEITYLYIKLRRYVKVADLVLQLESFNKVKSTDTAFCRWDRGIILHFISSNAAFASVDKSLFDVSYKQPIKHNRSKATTFYSSSII